MAQIAKHSEAKLRVIHPLEAVWPIPGLFRGA